MQTQATSTQQMRGFVAVWIGLTLLIGIATFVAIYVGTGTLDGGNTANALSGSALSLEDNDPVVAVAPDVNNSAADNQTSGGDDTSSAAAVDDDNADSNNAIGDQGGVAVAQETDEPDEPEQEPTPAPTTPAIEDKDFDLGIQVDYNNPDSNVLGGYLDAAANQLNLNWIKVQIRWEFVEPEEGVYDWTRLDNLFNTIPEYNLKVLASVVTAPDWARQPGADLSKHGPPADNQTFATFIANVLQRYPGRIHAVEVWNEMNIDREWASTGGISAPDYVAMVTSVANTVRFLDPNIIIVSGALSPTGLNNAQVHDDLIYTDELIAAGVLNVVDCYGAHHNGYNIGPNVPFDAVENDPSAGFRGPFDNPHPSWSFYTTLTTYANKIQAAGSDVPLCVTEFGWATTEDLGNHPPGFEFAIDNTLQEQGEFLVEAIETMEEWDFVWLAFIWNLNYAPEAGFEGSNDNVPYSLIRPNYVPSPGWLPISEMDFRGRE